MKCIVCWKDVSEGEICEECDKVMDIFYRKKPEDKEKALELFRKGGKK